MRLRCHLQFFLGEIKLGVEASLFWASRHAGRPRSSFFFCFHMLTGAHGCRQLLHFSFLWICFPELMVSYFRLALRYRVHVRCIASTYCGFILLPFFHKCRFFASVSTSASAGWPLTYVCLPLFVTFNSTHACFSLLTYFCIAESSVNFVSIQ